MAALGIEVTYKNKLGIELYFNFNFILSLRGNYLKSKMFQKLAENIMIIDQILIIEALVTL